MVYTRQSLLNLLDNANLGYLREQACDLLHYALFPRAHSAPGGVPAGASKMGGCPDLPIEMPWPCWSGVNGMWDTPRPLDFLLQINFAEARQAWQTAPVLPDLVAPSPQYVLDIELPPTVPPALPPLPLPADGLLSVFYDTEEQPEGGDEDEDQRGFYLLYIPADTSLAPHVAPDGSRVFELCRVHFDVGIPAHALNALRPFLGRWDHDALDEIAGRLTNGSFLWGGAHQMLGFGNWIQEDPIVRWDGIEGRVEDWLLLLQIDTDDGEGKPGWMWGDAGTLYFHIHKADLAVRDFSRVRMDMQSC